jgi:hypothetical protein
MRKIIITKKLFCSTAQTAHLRTYAYMKKNVCFDVPYHPLKFVGTFSGHPVYRIIKTGKPPYLREVFLGLARVHRTRIFQNFIIPRHRTAAFQRSFTFVAIKMWNGLPQYVKHLSLLNFKKYIKNMLLEE